MQTKELGRVIYRVHMLEARSTNQCLFSQAIQGEQRSDLVEMAGNAQEMVVEHLEEGTIVHPV